MSEKRAGGLVVERDDGQITYATEVISTIVCVATKEVEGIAGITGGSTISGIIGKGKGPKGVKVDVKGNHVSVDISVSVDSGIQIQKVGRNCQENVRKSIETMTGMHVDKVDLHVVSVSFDKEIQEMEESQNKAIALEEEEEAHALEEPVDVEVTTDDDVELSEDSSEEDTEYMNDDEPEEKNDDVYEIDDVQGVSSDKETALEPDDEKAP